ncbi:hypothetical protein D046_1954B, partial [Vibrio parahaemolyticus V-223/04]
FSLSS